MNGETYVVDATNTVALCFAKDAIAAGEALPLTFSAEPDWQTQQTVLVGRRAIGLAVLRPERCIQVRTAAP